VFFSRVTSYMVRILRALREKIVRLSDPMVMEMTVMANARPDMTYLAIRTLDLRKDDHERSDEMKEPHGEAWVSVALIRVTRVCEVGELIERLR